MRAQAWLSGALLVLCSCSRSFDASPGGNRGLLTLALTGADTTGVEYRLRAAHFQLAGYPDVWSGTSGTSSYSETLASDDEPDGQAIKRRLLPGIYTVSLVNDDWYLERISAAGAERVATAVLLSSRSQSAYVSSGSSALVSFRFGVDGTLIDFRGGELRIGVEIERAAGAGGGGAPSNACEVCERGSDMYCMQAVSRCDGIQGVTSGGMAGQPKADVCHAIVDCIHASHCAQNYNITDCICGTNVDPNACFSGSFGQTTGPCRDVIAVGAESTIMGEIANRFSDPNYAIGVADAVVENCDYLACNVCL